MKTACSLLTTSLNMFISFLLLGADIVSLLWAEWFLSYFRSVTNKMTERASTVGVLIQLPGLPLEKTQNKPHQYGRQISSLLGERALPPYNFVIRTVSSECFSNYIYSILLSFAFSSNGLIILHLVAKERMNWWTGFKGKNITDIFHKLVLWVSFV